MSPAPFPPLSSVPPSDRRVEPALDATATPFASNLSPFSSGESHTAPAPAPAPAQSHTPQGDGPASLEALLFKRPAPAGDNAGSAPWHANSGQAQEAAVLRAPATRPLEVLQAQAVRAAACADLDAELLLIHAGTDEGTTASTWMRQVLDGASLHSARYQDNVHEQVLLLLPHLVFIHFDVPVLDLATRLVEQLRLSHPNLPIVAVGRMRNPQSTLAALRSGVKEFLDLDDTSQNAQNTVRELVASNPSAMTDTGKAAPLTALISARAGSGCSLLASHLALYLQQRLHQHQAAPSTATSDPAEAALDTLLIDLGHPASDCAMFLNCYGEFDFLEAVHNLRRFDRKLAASAIARHAQGLRLLALPKQERVSQVTHADTDLILLRLRQYFQHVIADLGAVQQTDLAQRVALRASQIWVVCEQTVASVVSTTQLLGQLSAQKVDFHRIGLIVNRYDSRLELEAEHIAKQLQLPLLATIPDRRLPLTQVTNQGGLLMPSQHREPYVQELLRLTDQLAKQHSLEPALKANRGLSRFFQRNASA